MDGRNNVTHSYKHRKDFFRRDLPQDASLLSCKRDGCMVRSCLGCGRIAVRSLLQYDCRFLLSPPFWKRASCHRFQGAFRCGLQRERPEAIRDLAVFKMRGIPESLARHHRMERNDDPPACGACHRGVSGRNLCQPERRCGNTSTVGVKNMIYTTDGLFE